MQPPPPVIRITWHGEIHEISWQYIHCTCYRNTLLIQAYTQFSLPKEIRSFFKSKTSNLNLYKFIKKTSSLLKTPFFFGQSFSSSSSLPKVFPCQLLGWPPLRHRFGWSFPPRSPQHLEGGSTKDAAGVTTTHARPLFLEFFWGGWFLWSWAFFGSMALILRMPCKCTMWWCWCDF